MAHAGSCGQASYKLQQKKVEEWMRDLGVLYFLAQLARSSACAQNPVLLHPVGHPQPQIFSYSPQWLPSNDNYERWELKIKTLKATTFNLGDFSSSAGFQRPLARLVGQNSRTTTSGK